MIASGQEGHIVNTSSLGGFQGSQGAAIYSAAKAAVNNLSESYRIALEKYNIGVTVCCPANIKSNIAEATKTRPEHLKNTGYLVNEDTIASLHSIHIHGMEPVVLAGHIKKAVEDNQGYCVPYPEAKAGLEAHFRMILDSIPPVESDPEGVRERTEALRDWAQSRSKMFAAENPDAKR
jgi:short-subunit dehydrogenase